MNFNVVFDAGEDDQEGAVAATTVVTVIRTHGAQDCGMALVSEPDVEGNLRHREAPLRTRDRVPYDEFRRLDIPEQNTTVAAV